jgi:hypothetical protein
MITRVTPEMIRATDTADPSAIDRALELLPLVERARPLADAVNALALVLQRAPEVDRLLRAAEAEYRELLGKIERSCAQEEAQRAAAAAGIAEEATRTQEARTNGQRDRRQLADELTRATSEHHDALARLRQERTDATRAHEEFLAGLARDRAQAETDAAAHRAALEAEVDEVTKRRDRILTEIAALKAKL